MPKTHEGYRPCSDSKAIVDNLAYAIKLVSIPLPRHPQDDEGNLHRYRVNAVEFVNGVAEGRQVMSSSAHSSLQDTFRLF